MTGERVLLQEGPLWPRHDAPGAEATADGVIACAEHKSRRDNINLHGPRSLL